MFERLQTVPGGQCLEGVWTGRGVGVESAVPCCAALFRELSDQQIRKSWGCSRKVSTDRVQLSSTFPTIIRNLLEKLVILDQGGSPPPTFLIQHVFFAYSDSGKHQQEHII